MRLTTGRAVTLAIGVPVMLAAAGFGGISVTGLMAQTSQHHHVGYAWHGGPITLNTSSGSVHVVTNFGTQVVVSYTEHYQLSTPTVRGTTTADGGVRLTAKCPGGILGNNCEVNYTLTVPPGVNLNLRSGDGSITVANEAADPPGLAVTAHTGDGHITVTNAAGPLDLSSGDGSITADGDSTAVKASTGDGSVSLYFGVAPTTVDASSGDGSIHVSVPTGTGPYHVDASTGDGSTRISAPTDPAAPNLIKAHSGNGSVTVSSIGITHGSVAVP